MVNEQQKRVLVQGGNRQVFKPAVDAFQSGTTTANTNLQRKFTPIMSMDRSHIGYENMVFQPKIGRDLV